MGGSRRPNTELWKGKANIIKRVKSSWLVQVGTLQVLIPIQFIHDDSEVYDEGHNNEGYMVIPLWLAVDRHIENFGEEYESV